jgi:hypothetical protein
MFLKIENLKISIEVAKVSACNYYNLINIHIKKTDSLGQKMDKKFQPL